MIREQRKLDHIRYALELGDGERKTGLEDIRFLHNCLTPVEPDRVDIRTRIGNLKLPVPVMIDAITGGADRVKEINRKLAAVAGRCRCFPGGRVPVRFGQRRAACRYLCGDS